MGGMLGLALRDTGLGLHDVGLLARGADDAGFESLWIPEVGSRDALVVAALVGCQTRRATVGTGVVPVFSRNPVTLALAAATAAESSGGRFILGLGAGHPFTAQAWYSSPWRHPRTRLREMIDVVRRILAGERVSHHGEVRVDGFHLASIPPHVPIYLAGLTPGTLRMAGEIADGVLLNWLPPEGMHRCGFLVREAAADAGRTVRVAGYVRVAAADEPDQLEEAQAAVREQAYMYAMMPAYAASLRQAGLGDAIDAIAAGDERALDTIVDATCLVGDRDVIRKGLHGYEQAGLDMPIVYPVPYGDDPAESVLHTLRTAAD